MTGNEYFFSIQLKKISIFSSVRILNAILISASLVLSPLAAHANRSNDETKATGSIEVSPLTAEIFGQNATSLKIDFKVEQMDPEQAGSKVSEVLGQTDAETIIVSSDEDPVLSTVVGESKTQPKGRLFLLPFGKAVKTTAHLANGVNEALRFSGSYLVNAFKKDKIGVSIATFTLGNEIVRWMHVTTASNFVVTSNIVYSILWSSLFLDKDTWSKVTKPIQKTYRRLFKLAEMVPGKRNAADIGISFIAGLTLSLALNGGRVGIVGIDQLSRAAFAPLALTMPFVMGAVMTAAGFSWSELIGSIDEGHYPKAKKRLRFIMNARSCLISYFAASAMLMNPESYGLSPWIAVAISGTTGLFLYSNAARFVPLLEKVGLRVRRAGMCQSAFSS